jgi:hypothetical protein
LDRRGRSFCDSLSGARPEIWFDPLTWKIKPNREGIEYDSYDFAAFLKPDAAWSKAAAHTAVVGLPANVAWSYPNMSEIVAFYRSHRVKASLSFGLLFDDGDPHYKGIEGISQDVSVNLEAVKIAQLWKKAGAPLDYIIMDSPSYFGHFYPGGPHWPLEEVARRTAATLAGIRTHYPDSKIIEAVGPGVEKDEIWLPAMDAWFKAFRQATGVSIQAVILDLHWIDLRPGYDWITTARRARAYFAARGVRTGLIINDDQAGPGVTDASFLAANRRHLHEAIETCAAGDFISIAQWMGHPQRNLPETDPEAYTSLINDAFSEIKHAPSACPPPPKRPSLPLRL